MRQEQQPTAAFLSHTLSRPGEQIAHRQQRANGGFYITARKKSKQGCTLWNCLWLAKKPR
jgi:hypothetical protein